MYNKANIIFLVEKLKLKNKNISLIHKPQEKNKYILIINNFPLKFEKTQNIYTFINNLIKLYDNNIIEFKEESCKK